MSTTSSMSFKRFYLKQTAIQPTYGRILIKKLNFFNYFYSFFVLKRIWLDV